MVKDANAVTGPINAARVLLMDPDVELSLLAAGGLQEPNAQWTTEGLANVKAALAKEFNERKLTLIPYHPPQGDPGIERINALFRNPIKYRQVIEPSSICASTRCPLRVLGRQTSTTRE